MNKNKLKIIKVLFISLGFLSLLILAEVIYVLNNKPSYIANYFVNKAFSSAQKSDAEKSFVYLLKASSVFINYTSKKYPKLTPEKYSPNIAFPVNNPQFKKAYLKKTLSFDKKSFTKKQSNRLAKLIYEIGVLAYENNEVNLVSYLFQTAIYMEPELSHYHVALANFYLKSGKKEEAENSLDYCFKFKYPVKHCQDYYNGSFSSNSPEDVGFLEKELEKYYKISD